MVPTLKQRISAYDKKLTRSERRLVDELLARHPRGLLESATSLARDVGTSASTVVRLLSKLGYASYAEAQVEARSAVTALLSSASTRAHALPHGDSSVNAVLEAVLLHEQQNLAATFAELDIASFEATVRLLLKRRARVHLLGHRHGALIASHLALHLNLCLPDVRLMNAANPLFIEDEMLWLDEHDILVAPTFRRHSLATTRAARYFKERGAHVVVITDGPTAPPVASADQVLMVQTSSPSPFDSYTAALALANALIAVVAQRRKMDLEAALARGEPLWARHWKDG